MTRIFFLLIFALFVESVRQKNQLENLKAIKRRLEKELEEELGDDYILDLKKNYDVPDDYKYDIIPEFWEGHNIADFIDPELFKVFLSSFSLLNISSFAKRYIFS